MWKKLLGWTLFTCGILGVAYFIGLSVLQVTQALINVITDIFSVKFWGLIGAGIIIWLGWWLAHKAG